jgi:hypothetical protein
MAALGFLLSASAGCITFLTEIHVARDGSGTIVQTFSMNPQAFKGAMEEVAKGMGGSGEVKETNTEKKDDAGGPFSKTDFAAKAKELGEGVEFVSADPIESETAQGVRVTYRFRDVNALSLNPKPAAAFGAEGAGRSSPHAVRFRFERTGGRSVLTAVIPRDDEKKEAAPTPASNAEMNAEQLAMMKRMFKGMHLGMSLDFDGAITSTTASYRAGNRVTLIDLDMDPLLENPETLKKLNARLSSAMGDDAKTAAALSEFPGVRIETKPEIRVEFR